MNPDSKDSNLDVIPADVLALWQGKGGAAALEASASAPVPAAPTKVRQSLWWYVMLLLFTFALAESALASRYLGTQREEE